MEANEGERAIGKFMASNLNAKKFYWILRTPSDNGMLKLLSSKMLKL